MNPSRRNILAAAIATFTACLCWPFKAKAAKPKPQFRSEPSARCSFIGSGDPRTYELALHHMPTRNTEQARDFCLCISNPKSANEFTHCFAEATYIVPFRLSHVTRRLTFDWTNPADVAIFLHLDLILDFAESEFAYWCRLRDYLYGNYAAFRHTIDSNSKLWPEYKNARLRDPRVASV